MKKLTTILVLILIAQFSFGQYQRNLTPRVSPAKTISQTVGYTNVDIHYGSPSVNDRTIWGELVPFNDVWRAGANEATTVEFSNDVNINSKILKAGKYSFFVLPQENEEWTAIFSNQKDQWGAYQYDASKDALRIDVPVKHTTKKVEELTYTIQQSDFKNGSFILSWENKEMIVPFQTNYIETFKQNIVDTANKQPEYAQWVVYMQGADYLAKTGEEQILAMNWINKAEEMMNSNEKWDKEFYSRDYIKGQLYWTKAQLLANNNKVAKAKKYIKKMQKMEDASFYEKNKEKRGIDKAIKSWK